MTTQDRQKQKRLLRYLNDAHAMEKGALVSLRDISDRASDPEVRKVIDELIALAHTQVNRLAARIRALGGDVSTGKDLVNSVLGKGGRLLNALHDKADKQTQDIIKAYSLAHFEAGTYTSLRAYARAVDDEKTQALAQDLVGEEEKAAERLRGLIPGLAAVPARDGGAISAAHEGDARGGVMSRVTVPALVVGGVALALWGVSRRR